MKSHYILLFTGISILLSSCFNKQQKINLLTSEEMQIDTAQGSCPYLTTDHNGNTVLSWIKSDDSKNNIFCYAISYDKGKTFNKTIEIPGSTNVLPHGENMPKIIFKPSGEIIAVWGAANPNPKNPYSGCVYFSRSLDEGKTWSTQDRLVKDSNGIDQRYFDVALLKNGEAGIVWLDNRKQSKAEGSGLYFATTQGSSDFLHEQLVSEPCCQCCRTDLFVDSKGSIHVLYRAIINDSIRDMVHILSTNGGESFSTPQRISEDNWVINGCPHTGPAIAENKNGIQISWFTAGGEPGIYYCNSQNNGQSFSPRKMISGGNSKHCQITTLPDNNILTVWNENFAGNHVSSSRIGLEIRNENGQHPYKDFITSENGMATFPVIKTLDENSALVAYTSNIEGKDFIKYKIVRF